MAHATTTTLPPAAARRPFTARLGEALPFIAVGVLLLVVAPNVLSEFRLNLLGKFLTFAIIAVGYLVSALVRERGTAGGIAVGIWLVFVLIYDMALLGLLVVDQGQVLSGGLLNALLLLNPADAYRLFNLTGSAGVSAFSGMAGVAQSATLSPSTLLAALAAWALVPLALAAFAFSRREL